MDLKHVVRAASRLGGLASESMIGELVVLSTRPIAGGAFTLLFPCGRTSPQERHSLRVVRYVLLLVLLFPFRGYFLHQLLHQIDITVTDAGDRDLSLHHIHPAQPDL